MTVLIQSGYEPSEAGFLLRQDGDFLLQENGDKIILDVPATLDLPLINARIAHANNWIDGGTVTASSTETGYYASGPANTLTYERWKPTSASATWDYDLGSVRVIDYVCLASHSLGSNNNSIAIQTSANASGAFGDVIASTAIADDSPIMAIFSAIGVRRIRISISGGTAPEIGVIKCGRALQMQQPIYGGHRPVPFTRQTNLRTNYSETGEFLGRTRQRMMLQTEYAWTHLKADWMRSNWLSFTDAIRTEPFWIAWRPFEFEDVAYCQVDELPKASNMGIKDYMQVSMSVRARGYD